MAIGDQERGWWDAPVGKVWTCPLDGDGCGKTSLIAEWEEAFAYCEDCGEHDGRRCPRCGEIQDHVWGAPKIAEATVDPDGEPDPQEVPDGR